MATATAPARPPKVTPADVAAFNAMKSRVLDFFNNNAAAIAAGKTEMTAAVIFAEMEWLCHELDRLGGPPDPADAAKFGKVRATVTRVCDDQGDAILTGAFVAVSARIWVKYRLLVRWVEAGYRRVLDMDEVARLGGAIPAEHQARVVLDVEDDVADDPE